MRLVVLLLAVVAVSLAFQEPTLADFADAFNMDRTAGARAAAEQLAVIRVRRSNGENVQKELATLKHYIQLRRKQFHCKLLASSLLLFSYHGGHVQRLASCWSASFTSTARPRQCAFSKMH